MQEEELNAIWHNSLELIKMQTPASSFTTMFAKTCIKEIKDDVVTIGCSNTFTKTWIENNQQIITKNALSKVIGKEVNVTFTIYTRIKDTHIQFESDSLFGEGSPMQHTTNIQRPFSSSAEHDLRPSSVSSMSSLPPLIEGLNARYTFENFIIGSSNRLAHAAALAVCDKPGIAYNPFFLYGKVGLGKTHLMHAIGNDIARRNAAARILYTSSETFLNEFIQSIKTNKNANLRKKYRDIDVLMIDDIQFISGKEATQEEFFHTFNSLHQANKQIILASDRPPKEISKLEERLRSRFEGGMVADINTPDFEMRVAILQKKLEDKSIHLPTTILEIIASQYVNNIRELEGALTKVLAIRSLSSNTLSEEEVRKILDIQIVAAKSILKPKRILENVCEQYGISIKDIKGQRRTATVANVRQIAMYFLRNELNLPLKEIATILGRKDHTTIIHGLQRVEERIASNISFRDEINIIKMNLREKRG